MKTKLSIISLIVGCLSISASFANDPQMDSMAVNVLHKTNTNLQNLQSCSFTAHIAFDTWGDDVGMIKHSCTEKIYLKNPDKFHITSIGDKGHHSMWYNGKVMNYYSFVNNQYAETAAPNNLVQAIDTINTTLGIEFAAVDFFYPDFVEDIFDSGSNLIYLGMAKMGGKDCFHIAGKNETASFQFWIADSELFLPVKMSIIYINKENLPRYEATYDQWEINPVFPSEMFEFTPPPHSKKVKFTSF